MLKASFCKMRLSGLGVKRWGFSSGSAITSVSTERRNDLAIQSSFPLTFYSISQQKIRPLPGCCDWRIFHTSWESWKMYRWLCCTFKHFNLCQYSNFLHKAHFILGNLIVVVVFINDSMPIISFLACLMVSRMLHFHFVKALTMADKKCQKSPTLIFLLCLSFVLFLWLQ